MARSESVPRLLACIAVAIALAGCSSDEAMSSGTEIETAWHVAVDKEALSPPGTLLGPGIEVQEGSSRVGPSFPLFHPPSHPDSSVIGWQALLVVEGDPIDVWDRYVDALGYGEAARATHRCSVRKADQRDSPMVVSRSLTEPVLDGEDQIDCQIPHQMVMTVGASICFTPPCPPRATGHLYLSIETEGPGALPNVTPTTAVPGPTLVPPRLTTNLPSRLPTVGERYDDGLDYALSDAPALVPSGARSLVAPTLVNTGCVSSSVTMLDLPDEPAAVVAAFATIRDPVTDRRLGTRADQRWATGYQGLPDGYALTITAVEAANGHSTVLIYNCGS